MEAKKRIALFIRCMLFACLAVAMLLSATPKHGRRLTETHANHTEHHHEEECEANTIADPLDLQEPWQAAIYGAAIIYSFLGIAMVCEDFFVTAIDELTEVNQIPPDVAGATFMAAGSSSPEVFAALMGLFFSSSEGGGAGVGTVVGSAVFNVLVIIGGAALYSDMGISLPWRPLLRDAGFYAISLVALWVCFDDGILTAVESTGMVLVYVAYILVCAFFETSVKTCCPENKDTEYKELDEEKADEVAAPTGKKELDSEEAQQMKMLLQTLERDRYKLFKNARKNLMASYFGDQKVDNSKFAEDELAKLKHAFSMFDSSHSGKIERGEIQEALTKLGVNTSTDLVEDLWAVLDTDKDGEITFDEFAPVYVNWLRYGLKQQKKLILSPEQVKKMQDTFATLDTDHSGTLSKEEISVAFDKLGSSDLERDTIVQMFKHVGETPGEMSMTQFKALYTQWLGYGWQGESEKFDKEHLVSHDEEHPEEGHHLCRWPDTITGRINFLIGFPFAFMFHFTVPNCSVPKLKKYYAVTMFMSIIWLGVLVFFMISWAEKAGCLLGISPTLMGLTICAAGTSGPDAIASLIVAADGHGVMAVSNAFGSNVFDILFGLGFPFMLKTFIDGDFTVSTDGLTEAIYIMFGVLGVFILAIALNKMTVSRQLGYLFLFMYGCYVAYAIMTTP